MNILKKIIYKIKKIYYYYKYDYSFFINSQKKLFEIQKLDRTLALEKLEKLKQEYDFFNYPMSSEHQVIFSSLALKPENKTKNILEIGTFDATNSFLLSKLFPEASIDTIDLPDEDINFTNTYKREDISYRNQFIDKRNKLLSKSKNVNFLQINSLELTSETNKKYDLIWVDGSHINPVVTIDIINALRLVSDNGTILCDDVYLDNDKEDNIYESDAAFRTLEELKKAKEIEYLLFYKRLSKVFNSIPKDRKYIGFIKKKKK